MVDTREEIRDGSQTARLRGTYGARQRWISNAPAHTVNFSSNPLKTIPRVTCREVEKYLGSLGYSSGEEAGVIQREVEEITALRKEYDHLKNIGIKRESDLKILQEKVASLQIQTNNSKDILLTKDAAVTQLGNKIESVERKLEEQLADTGVYKHMIQRLTDELQEARLVTKVMEESNYKLGSELHNHNSQLLASRQEKAAVENLLKTMQEDLHISRGENFRALSEIDLAAEQTHKRVDLLKNREKTRMKLMAQAHGELTSNELRKLTVSNVANHFKFNKLSQEIARTDKNYRLYESYLHQIAEAAGTNDIDKIIAKFISRDETLEALKREYAEAETRMKRLRDKHILLKEKLLNLRGSATNTRVAYMEMDEISTRLKDIEKSGTVTEERCFRAELTLESLRTSMMKSIKKLNTIKDSYEYSLDRRDTLNGNIFDSPLVDLVALCESKVSRIMDAISREKGDTDSRGDMAQKKKQKDDGLIPLDNETEEHFILRVCQPDVSKNNVRVHPKNKTSSTEYQIVIPDDPIDDNETIIDRGTRKKLAGMVLNREKRGNRSSKSTP